MALTNEIRSERLQDLKDLSHGAILILSGGPFDLMNPPEVRRRMDQIIAELNADPWVLANTENNGLIFRLLDDQQTPHIHQTRWREICDSPQLLNASPLIVVGHSNGGAAAMDVARVLQDRGQTVDLLFTADSVLTLDDNGDPYQVPPNVRMNLNSYSIPMFPIWWTAPFPFGKKNQRQVDGSLSALLNIGLSFPEPGALEHRDVFYDVAGGDPKGTGYQYPELICDAALAVLRGATAEEIFHLAERYLQVLSDRRLISISLEVDGTQSTLRPGVDSAQASTDEGTSDTIANLHLQMNAVEQIRLSVLEPSRQITGP